MLTAARSPLHPPPTERRRGNRRGVRLGPASETSESTTLGSGSGPTDTRPATDDAPANRARGGEPHGRPRGAPRPPRRRRAASGTGVRGSRRDGPLRAPPSPRPRGRRGDPPGVFKPTRRDAVARYPDRGRGRKRGRGERRRDETRLARSRLRPGATAGRRRGALPFPRRGNGRAPPPRETERNETAGRERGSPTGRRGAGEATAGVDGGERERDEGRRPP